MRSIPLSLKEKIEKANQTIWEKANPQMGVQVRRAKSSLTDTDLFYVETIREKPGLSDIGVALYRPDPNAAPTFVYEIHNDNGMIKTTLRDLSDFKQDRWKHQFDVGLGKACSIEFDGYWVADSKRRYNLITEEKPWLFWTDNSDILYAQKWDDSASRLQLAGDVKRVATIRGWKNIQVNTVDQGLIVAYTKSDGNVYYRNYAKQEDGSFMWEMERQIIEFSNVQNLGLFRTNDYRIGFIVESSGSVSWILTKRAWAGMGIPPENIMLSISEISIGFKEINRIDSFTSEKITVGFENLAINMLYGAPYNSFTEIYNNANDVNDYGYLIRATLEYPITNATHTDFALIDSMNTIFNINSINNIYGNLYEFTVTNFNDAKGDMTLSFLGSGATLGEAGQSMNPFSKSFTPTGLVPTFIPPPQVVSIINIE
jgi:hypothetical protein